MSEDVGWERLAGGRSGAEVFGAGTDQVVKRLVAPVAGDPGAWSQPAHVAWWRREADVLLGGELTEAPGVRPPRLVDATEDDEGIVLCTERVAAAQTPEPTLAHALGELAGASLVSRPWWARHVLADRLDAVEARGGWPTLARTPLADVADRLWTRRHHHLAVLDELPQVPGHGDPTPANLRGSDERRVVAVDWACAGSAALGADLGYLALSCRVDLETLLAAYASGAGVDPADARTAAVVTACYTAITRTEQVLASAARGPGALVGKLRHPTVTPSIRVLQRLYPHLETLL